MGRTQERYQPWVGTLVAVEGRKRYTISRGRVADLCAGLLKLRQREAELDVRYYIAEPSLPTVDKQKFLVAVLSGLPGRPGPEDPWRAPHWLWHEMLLLPSPESGTESN